MQLQNGFTRSVPHFSQNTATTRAETQSAVKAKTDRTSTPKLLIICKRIGDYNHRSHSCEGPKIRGTSPCQTREPLIIKQSSDSLTPHLWASVPPPDKVNNETQQLHITLIDIFWGPLAPLDRSPCRQRGTRYYYPQPTEKSIRWKHHPKKKGNWGTWSLPLCDLRLSSPEWECVFSDCWKVRPSMLWHFLIFLALYDCCFV